MRGLIKIKALVKAILEADTMARNSDSYLYLRVIDTVAKTNNVNLQNISVIDFLNMLPVSVFPQFESVRRSRQKVQAEFPYLGACEKVSEYRAENEEEYRDFARS